MSASSIRRSAAELRELAERLLQIASERELEVEPMPAWGGSRGANQCGPVDLAWLIYKARAERSTYFDGNLLGEPGWDMLLDLFIAGSSGKVISTTSLCHAARVAQTTGLRWIANLEEAGLLERVADEIDGRVVNVRMTTKATKQMNAYLKRHLAAFGFSRDLRLVHTG